MGHIQEMTEEQKADFYKWQYERLKESRRRTSFEWWNEEKHGKLLESGWSLYEFKTRDKVSTRSMPCAKKAVEELRKAGNYARIVCGLTKIKQRIRHFTVIYKKKGKTS